LHIPTGPADQACGVDRDTFHAHGRMTDTTPEPQQYTVFTEKIITGQWAHSQIKINW